MAVTIVSTPEEQRQLEAVIALLGANLAGMEQTRIQAGNRAAQAMRAEPDKDGVMRGLALREDSPLAGLLLDARDGLKELEKTLEKEIERQMKRHPLAPWIAGQKGLGWKTTGRLISCIGDPYLRTVVAEDGSWTQEPRTVYQLWSYCGMSVLEDGTTQVRRKGVQSNWNGEARKRLYVIATSQRYGLDNCYRPVYEDAKKRAQDAVHARPCNRCGPAGSPAPAGSPLGNMHVEFRALRAISKTLLKELWRESRRLHGVTGNEDGLADKWGPHPVTKLAEPV